nr:phage major capsid protein [Streptomyces cacaoi]
MGIHLFIRRLERTRNSTMTTLSSAATGLTPPEYGALVEQPVAALSVAFLAGTLVGTKAHTFHVPVLTSDVVLGPVAEGAEIDPSDATFDELAVTPVKFAGLSIVSRELIDDSSPSASEVVGRSIARQISESVDKALLNPQAGINPQGLADLDGISTVDAGATLTDLDPFQAALATSERNGGQLTSWITDADTALAMATLKEASTSNRSLLTADMTVDGRRQLLGRPIYVSPQCPAGKVYGVSGKDLLVIQREGTRLDVDYSAYFSSDRVGVRGSMRVAFAMPTPSAHVIVSIGDDEDPSS